MKKPAMYWDAPWSLVEGCKPCSPGCDHCWSSNMVYRLKKETDPPPDYIDSKGAYNDVVRFRADRLDIPWRRKKPTIYAVWTDLFHEAVSDEDIYSAFEEMFHCPQHTFLLLTKRAERMMELSQHIDPVCGNLWFGVTACNQAEADQKIPLLLQTHAVRRYVSFEPGLGAIDFTAVRYAEDDAQWCVNTLTAEAWCENSDSPSAYCTAADGVNKLDLVICGPETGIGRRPFDPAWASSLAAECKAAGVPFFYKGDGLDLPRELPWRK